MSPFVIYILLCAASTAPGDCDTRNAIDVVLGPEANNEIMCGLEFAGDARENLAPAQGWGIRENFLRSASPSPNS